MKIFLTFLVFLSTWSLNAETVSPSQPVEKTEVEATEFSGEQLAIKKRIEDLFTASKSVNVKGAESQKTRGQIESAMDWDKIAETCLGTSVYKKQGAGASEFKRLLKDVVIKTAYSRLDKFWADGTTYKIAKIDVKGNSAVVLSKFYVKKENFALEYYLTKKAGNWFVWDISYETERYSENIHEQITAFLREKKFADLLEKLKKRLAELNDESKTDKG